jgi:cytoplasmic iron level regulating protein YaaA (DUF328/UPF0246 family)
VNPKDRASEEMKPAIFAFSGVAYQGLHATECSDEAIEYMQDTLRIVDPLYGTLRPLDVIQPYRLEMATKKVFIDDDKIKLANWWKDSVTKALSRELESSATKILLNLASDEYSAAVDPTSLPKDARYIKVNFLEEGRTIAVHAKRARGLMVRFLAENNVQDLQGVKKFAKEGYSFVGSKSDDSTLVFDRKKRPTAKKKAASSSAGAPAKKRAKKTK